MVGTTLNHYRIIKLLGVGGMGEVYAAEDVKLRRQVAVKVLPATVASDPERRRRFEREAHAIAALNHPHIVTIYSIEQADDYLFLSMELVQGRPLSHVIPARGLPLDQLLTLAIPIADAISAAHEQGIVHRDLKPDNIMVASDGRPKVLDFGIARLKDVARDPSAATTLTLSPLAAERQIVGTAAYMSPEQAEGRDVDHRSDIFSLGIVLYQMATGERPFKGDTSVSLLSSIVKDTPRAITAVNPILPGELARIVRRSLAKDTARRYQTAADVRNDLQELKDLAPDQNVTSAVPGKVSQVWNWLGWATAAVTLVLALVGLLTRAPAVDPPADVLSLVPPANTMLDEGEAPQISPDGRTVAFVATDDSGKTLLFVRGRGSLVAQPLSGTEDATQPFWSPDSRWIGFFAAGQLKKISLAGGRPQTLAPAPVPRGGTWNGDDVILFGPHPEQPLHRISAGGGDATPLPVESGSTRWFPSFLPDGRRFLYLAFREGVSQGIWVASLGSTETTLLVQTPSTAQYLEHGHLVFRRDGSLIAQRLNLNTLQLEGGAVTLADVVSFNPITLQTLFSASRHGELAYLSARRSWQLTWFDRGGRRLGSAGTIGGYNSLCLSSDGQKLVYDASDTSSGNVDIYSLTLADGTIKRLTFDPTQDFYAACSPSDDAIVFASPRDGRPPNLYRLLPSAPSGETLLRAFELAALPTDWSGNGQYVVYSAFSPKTSWDIYVERPGGEGNIPYLATEAAEQNGHLSPNGRWMAYSSGQAGTYELYVRPFPATSSRWQISQGGGRQPQWDPQGKQLFYISSDKKLIAVDVDTSGPTFISRASRVLIDTRIGGWERTYQGNPYDITADGQRFLIASADAEKLSITMVFNWPSLVTTSAK